MSYSRITASINAAAAPPAHRSERPRAIDAKPTVGQLFTISSLSLYLSPLEATSATLARHASSRNKPRDRRFPARAHRACMVEFVTSFVDARRRAEPKIRWRDYARDGRRSGKEKIHRHRQLTSADDARRHRHRHERSSASAIMPSRVVARRHQQRLNQNRPYSLRHRTIAYKWALIFQLLCLAIRRSAFRIAAIGVEIMLSMRRRRSIWRNDGLRCWRDERRGAMSTIIYCHETI